jgi:hypothetical protein
MNDRETIRIALYDAIEWQQSLADSYGDKNDPDRIVALKDVARYRAVLKRRYRQEETPRESYFKNSTTVTLDELRARNKCE